MNFKINYTPRHSFLEIIVSGPWSIDTAKKIFDAIYASNNYPINLNQLWDMRDVDFSSIEYEDMEKVLSLREQYTGWTTYRKATIVRDDEMYGMSKLGNNIAKARLSCAIEMQTFKDYDEGKKWLLDDA